MLFWTRLRTLLWALLWLWTGLLRLWPRLLALDWGRPRLSRTLLRLRALFRLRRSCFLTLDGSRTRFRALLRLGLGTGLLRLRPNFLTRLGRLRRGRPRLSRTLLGLRALLRLRTLLLRLRPDFGPLLGGGRMRLRALLLHWLLRTLGRGATRMRSRSQ
jgi:hypothetical protein